MRSSPNPCHRPLPLAHVHTRARATATPRRAAQGTGDLEGASGAKVGGVIYAMLQDAAGVLEEDEGLRKLSVVFGAFEFAVTLDDAHVYVVKKATS